jgi:3D (Asp-Asp-Asp) domain-containing protein
MRFVPFRAAPLALLGFVYGCTTRSLPTYEQPIARTQLQSVRTTAYTHTESDHLEYGRASASGTQLKFGAINSAAADWSRWPAGTIFRILDSGELYRVDDYGWALSGTNTIDLYKPSVGAMRAWGTRRVNIENLEWGDPGRSLAILRGRTKFRHVQRMVAEFTDHYPTPPIIVQRPADPSRANPVEPAAAPGPARPRFAPFYSAVR